MRRSGLDGQLNMDGKLGSEEIGCSSEVANVISSSTQGDINLCSYQLEDQPIKFTSVERWKIICLQCYDNLVNQTSIMGTKYLVFCEVTKDDLTEIDRSRRNLPIRILYDFATKLLIVKVIVGKAHHWVGGLFTDLLREKVRSRCGDPRTLSDMGSFRCSSALGREKEPDVALVPRNRSRVEDWPSVVIEVGVLDSLVALRSDAQFWIFHSASFTRVVLVIAVDTQSKVITIERWGNESLVCTDGLSMVQSVTIDSNGVVGAPLVIPSDLIFDVGHVPQGVLGTDFSFDATELISFFKEFWGMLN